MSKEELANFEKILDDYENKIGISNIAYNSEVENVLNMSNTELSSMTALQCGEAAFLITQFSLYIQKEYNRNSMRKDWAESKINILLGKYGHQYGDQFTKFELLKSRLVTADTSAEILYKIFVHASARCRELQDISNRLNMMGRVLLDYQQTKSRHNI